jgi:tRNA A58 N-methylase Trm61
MNYIARYYFFLTVFFTTLIFFSGCSQHKPNVIDYPGTVDLVYLGKLDADPKTHKATVNGMTFYTTKTTVVPSLQSAFLLENTVIEEGDDVLDIGTGSGIQAIFAARKARRVVATDISPDAVYDTKQNVAVHSLQRKIDVRQGDLFGPVKEGEKFDVIILNIGYPYDEQTTPLWKVHERFFDNVRRYMKPDATIFYEAGWIRNIGKIKSMMDKNKLVILKMNMIYAYKYERQPIVFHIKTEEAVQRLRKVKIQ